MTPQEDARVLLALVDRHLRALRLNLDPAYPDEEWGFTAQQSESWRRLRSCGRMLGVGLGRGKMRAWMDWWQEKLEETTTAKVAGILGA